MKKFIFDPAGMKDTSVESYRKKEDGLIARPQMKPHPGYGSTFVAVDPITRYKYLTYNNSGTSFNTYDSYGQLLKETGKVDDAILMYKRSVELNPDNQDGKRMLEQLLKVKS